MNGEIKGGRERRRRRLERRSSGRNEIQMALENVEQNVKTHVSQSSGQLLRRDTFTVMKSKSELGVPSDEERVDCKSLEGSANDSTDSKNVTYNINPTSEESVHGTYNLDKFEKTRETNELRPVPAPRRSAESEKLSSDTDRDVAEIDSDDFRVKSAKSPEEDMKSSTSSNLIFPPVPKPRTKKTFRKDSESEKPNLGKSLKEKDWNSNSNDGEGGGEGNELPLIKNLEEESKTLEEESKKRKFVNELFYQKGKKKKGKRLVSMMKLEKSKMPKMSAILKELKEAEKETKMEELEDKTDFLIDSPHYPESVQNGQIYVQSKRGFYVMERDEVLKRKNAKTEVDGNGGRMEDSTVKTAILFQSYWSRSMIYFHGVLAGFAFGHAATVTAIMMHYNYEAQPFLSVYSCLSLKVHYAFYALTALCIVSCFDRLDMGHINKKHLQVAWKAPSMWMILCFYAVSFGLTFSNQTAEARFDALAYLNRTEVKWGREEQVNLLQWYHTVWARDVLVLLAWLVISLTKFPDFLRAHLNNMVRYVDVKGESIHLHRLSHEKTENS